jgi:hypothetical protein
MSCIRLLTTGEIQITTLDRSEERVSTSDTIILAAGVLLRGPSFGFTSA